MELCVCVCVCAVRKEDAAQVKKNPGPTFRIATVRGVKSSTKKKLRFKMIPIKLNVNNIT